MPLLLGTSQAAHVFRVAHMSLGAQRRGNLDRHLARLGVQCGMAIRVIIKYLAYGGRYDLARQGVVANLARMAE